MMDIYFLRHKESIQNKTGFGISDTSLTEKGKKSINDLVKFIDNIGLHNIGLIITGTKKRHIETLDILTSKISYKGEVLQDFHLNALFSGPLIEQNPYLTEKEYGLDRFKPGSNGLYISDDIIFNPVKTGVFPFDPLYCQAYFRKDLREIVFPDEKSIISFEEIETRIKQFQEDLKKLSNSDNYLNNVLIISSCSPNGFNLEYSVFNTIGENIYQRYGTENRFIFPQAHDEVMVLGIDNGKLKTLEGNVKISNYIK